MSREIRLKPIWRVILIGSLLVLIVVIATSSRVSAQAAVNWSLVWSDEFNANTAGGLAGTGVNIANWFYDIGTSYPNGAPHWGTHEVETMTYLTSNVYEDGNNLVIKPIYSNGQWTSGRIESQRSDFEAPPGGILRVVASIQQPNVSGAAAAGYWPAFWMVGAPFRPLLTGWPGIGELDIIEDVNGLNSVFGTMHCGVDPGGACNEPYGFGSGRVKCTTCQTSFHTYEIQYDRSVSPEQLRWYVDGANYYTISANQIGQPTWDNATKHGFFIILNVAMGGNFPASFGGGPTSSTQSGAPMLVDYVRVYTGFPATPTPSITPTPGPVNSDTFGVYRTSSGMFFLRNTNTSGYADEAFNFQYGSSPYPVAGSWTSGRSDTVGLMDQSNAQFFLRNSNTAGTPDDQFVLGISKDEPIAGQWTTGSGQDGIGVFRSSNGLLLLRNSLSTGFADYAMILGIPGDQGLAGDWSGAGHDSPGVYRPATQAFFLSNQVTNSSVFADYSLQLGNPGDSPMSGDWIAQGHAGVGVFRPTNGLILLKNQLQTGYADIVEIYGIPNDVPISGHWTTNVPAVANPSNVLVTSTAAPIRTPLPGGNNLGG